MSGVVSEISTGRAGVLVFGAALILRLTVLVIAQPWDPAVEKHMVLINDSADYHGLAVSLLEDHRFAVDRHASPDPWHTPVYPALMAVIYAIFGARPWTVLAAQAVLDSFTALILFALARRFLQGRIAPVAAALGYALDPIAILHTANILTDVLYVFVMVAGASLLAGAIRDFPERVEWNRCVLAGAVFGLAALVRPVGLYMPAALAVLLIWLGRRSPRRTVLAIAAFSIQFFMTTAPWQMRNWALYRSLSLTAMGDFDTIALFTVPIEMELRNVTDHEARKRLMAQADELMRRDGIEADAAHPLAKAPYWNRVARGLALEHPLLFAKYYMRGVLYFWTNMATGRIANLIEHRQDSPVPTAGAVDKTPLHGIWEPIRAKSRTELLIACCVAPWFVLTYFAAAWGLATAIRSKLTPFLWLCGTLVLYYVLITGTAGLARFKLPAIPFYSVFAGIGVASAIGAYQSRRLGAER